MGSIEVVDLNGNGPFTYNVDHFHFHAPAEHKFNGIRHELEMHIVHKIAAGPNYQNYKQQLGVIGILFRKSEKSHPFVQRLQIEDMGRIDYINLRNLFGLSRKEDDNENAHNFYHYHGSLTNPPCSDIVNWFILDDAIPISEEHLE